jgi:stage III sporulation protein AH
MKKEESGMAMNKQTVWLVTMLALMVVLSAYYLVTGPVQPADQATMSKDGKGDINVDIKTTGLPANSKGKSTLAKGEGDDYFIAYQLERSTLRQKLTEDYMKVLTNPDASKQELQEAQAKLDQLMKVDNAEGSLEELIRKEGFRDAVVITGDSHVDVIVQTDNLSRRQAVKLIDLAKRHLNVPSNQVSVSYRS